MAAKYWPGEDPIGRRLKGRTGPWITVIGISGDVIQDWFDRRNAPTMYRPIEQAPGEYLAAVVRTSGDAAIAAGAVRQALLRVDPQQPAADRVKGPGPWQVRCARNDPLGAADHLLRRAAREREEQDAARVGAVDHELRDPVRERRGLAGPGTRDHVQRCLAPVQHGLALLLVQCTVWIHLSI
jgi:hypothetical protein